MKQGNFIKLAGVLPIAFAIGMAFLFYSCKNEENVDLMEITFDIGQNTTIPLSEITEEITSIKLELTDESVINPDIVKKVLLYDSLVFVTESEQLLIFDIEGKFIRSIGSKGQGPGEFVFIKDFTFDKKNKIIYIVNNSNQIISYDLNGNFLKVLTLTNLNNGQILSLDYLNNELLLFSESIIEKQNEENENLKCFHSIIYKVNNELQFVDSCFVRDEYWGISRGYGSNYFLTCNSSAVYLYYHDLFSLITNIAPSLSQHKKPDKRVLLDTLYRFEGNQLIPELKLKLKRNGKDYDGSKNIQISNIYRSSRYIFVMYSFVLDFNNSSLFIFCYDTKTGISYNSTKYKDDFNNIEKEILNERQYRPIRPICNDTELLYYVHTHMNSEDLEEPNPTLYIGKLKKIKHK